VTAAAVQAVLRGTLVDLRNRLRQVTGDFLPVTHRGDAGWITASVVDPFGSILGITNNSHDLQILGANGTA
jgi:hypothetical protein